MLFHSLHFLFFLLLVFILHWKYFANSLKKQNILLILASYYFYASWDYRFLGMLLLSTLIDYYSGIKISKAQTQKTKKTWLSISIAINLGLLGFFKYFNFFLENLFELLQTMGMENSYPLLSIILPVGISFYTFHGMSYVLDIYHHKIEPTRDFVQYALFVCFFPLLVAGPIERANHLLPQLKQLRKFKYAEAVSGLKQILWGLFKKIVIADNCAEFANYAFEHHTTLPAPTLILGVLFFSFQIYGDFSGYTDMAIGTGKLFGIQLLRNFSFPYFATSIADFWKRWHISLTSWFRDYLYIPMGGNRVSKMITLRNTFVVFLVSGFWHGANWTFLIWGFLHFLFFLPGLLLQKNKSHNWVQDENNLKGFLHMAITFSLVSFAWIFFRAPNLQDAIQYIQGIGTHTWLLNPFADVHFKGAVLVLGLLVFFVGIEWEGRKSDFALEHLWMRQGRTSRWMAYSFLLFVIGMYMHAGTSPFIYFQF